MGEVSNIQWLDSVSETTSGENISIMVRGPKTYTGSRSSKEWPGGMSQNIDVTLAGSIVRGSGSMWSASEIVLAPQSSFCLR